MSKAQTLAATVSTGNVLADGTVAYSEVSGTPTLPTGDIVGTSDTQTLTNKTITFADNTLTGVSGLDVSNTFTGAQIGTVTALTYAATISIDLATNNNFSYLTATGNTTLGLPSNPVAGQSGVITITQGATARTMAYNTFWKFAGGTVPTLTATAGAVDVLVYNVESATRATCQLIKDVK